MAAEDGDITFRCRSYRSTGSKYFRASYWLDVGPFEIQSSARNTTGTLGIRYERLKNIVESLITFHVIVGSRGSTGYRLVVPRKQKLLLLSNGRCRVDRSAGLLL